MTPQFPTGTDRVAYAAERVDCDVVANIQGDEPLLESVMLDQIIRPFHDDPAIQVSTLKQRVKEEADYHDVNVVKVVTDLDGFALYFSRASIPGNLSNACSTWRRAACGCSPVIMWWIFSISPARSAQQNFSFFPLPQGQRA